MKFQSINKETLNTFSINELRQLSNLIKEVLVQKERNELLARLKSREYNKSEQNQKEV